MLRPFRGRVPGETQRGRLVNRVRLASAIAVCATTMAVGASAAAAKTTTIHLFSKDVYSRISDANGHPQSGKNFMPKPGDRFSFAANDFLGNHKHHGNRQVGSDHVVCIIQSNGTGLCDGTIAIGGSMILGDDFVLDFNSNAPITLKITGGTGRYRHARGTVVAKSTSQNTTDLTIRVTT